MSNDDLEKLKTFMEGITNFFSSDDNIIGGVNIEKYID